MKDIIARNGPVGPENEYLAKPQGQWLAVPGIRGTLFLTCCSRLDLMKEHGGIDLLAMYPAGAQPTKAADAWTWEPIYGLPAIHFPRWPDTHIGPWTVNLSITKHVFFLFIVAAFTFFMMWWTGRALNRQRAGQKGPTGLAGAMEGMVLWVRDDIAIANIGRETGAKFVPLILALFFFILFANLFGLLPFATGSSDN